MSSFKDPETRLNAPAPAADDESQKVMPLMGGVVKGDALPEADGLDGSGPRAASVLSGGTLLILLVAAAAAGALFLMRSTQGNITAGATDKSVEAKIEQALVKLARPEAMAANDPLRRDAMRLLFQDTDAVVAMFTDDGARRQVPVDYLKKDPFVLLELQPVVPVGAPPPAPDGQAAARRQLQEELADLKLETVIEGQAPMAIISGSVVRPGQSLGSFRVRAIAGLSVELEARGQTYRLTMETEAKPDAPRRAPRR